MRQLALTEAQVAEIRRRALEGEAIAALARSHRVSTVAVRNAVIGRTWRHLQDPPPLKDGVIAARRAADNGFCNNCGLDKKYRTGRCIKCYNHFYRYGHELPLPGLGVDNRAEGRLSQRRCPDCNKRLWTDGRHFWCNGSNKSIACGYGVGI